MSNVRLDESKIAGFLPAEELNAFAAQAEEAKKTLLEGTGEGNDYIGWIDLPENYDKEEYDRIKKAAAKIRSDSDVLVVIGIGGSYLGARAAVAALTSNFRDPSQGTEVLFAGNSLSPTYLADLLDAIGGRDFSLNVISKSGTTTEPAIAFRILKEKLEEKYGAEEAAKRIYATTDRAKGALKTLSDASGYETFVVPDDVGGRFSVLTAVGLLPIAAAGIDIDALMAGAQAMRKLCIETPFEKNDAMRYAAIRYALYGKGKEVEILANYEPNLHYVSEWWKQLYGESEGKDGKGLFPAAVDLTTDLHSMGQYIQDGLRILMETVMHVEKPRRDLEMKEEAQDLDGLNYLAGKTMHFVNESAMEGTMLAHLEGGVPQLRVCIPELDPFFLGELFYFFEFAVGVSGYMLGVNPFNQPGVEFYKRNMFHLLGKPGY